MDSVVLFCETTRALPLLEAIKENLRWRQEALLGFGEGLSARFGASVSSQSLKLINRLLSIWRATFEKEDSDRSDLVEDDP